MIIVITVMLVTIVIIIAIGTVIVIKLCVDSTRQKRRLLVMEKALDFGALFPQVDAIMLHGGLGVTSEALLVSWILLNNVLFKIFQVL